VIRAFVSDGELRAGVGRSWLILGGLGACLLAISLFVADRLGASAVRSIQHLDDVARRLGEGDLDARAKPAPIRELDEVGTTLNALAGRIRDLLARERESVADLSHRVRTPLTVLRIDAEALTDQAEAERLTRDVLALERAVDQVIIDARRGAAGETASDATEVVRERVDFWRALADEEHRTVTSDLPTTPTPVAVAADDLAASLDALLGNVFSHTPEGTPFAVDLRPRPNGGALLTVTDEGPGFRNEDDALSRGTSDAGSTGLGLDIVRRTAESSGGGMTIANGPTRVTVELGPPAAR
jgi:signal transduction histidine kinase